MEFDRVKFAGLRRTQGITQGLMATMVGVTRQTIAKWEKGDATPSIKEINLAAKAFGITGDDLVVRGEGR